MMKQLRALALVLLLMLGLPEYTSAQCTLTNATSCVCATAGQTNCDLLPDITISWKGLESYGSYGGPSEYPQNHATNPGRLRVTGSTPNIGNGPLNVRGVNRNGYRFFLCGNELDSIYDVNATNDYVPCPDAKQLILQRVYHKNGNAMSFTERFAGTMTYHPTHGHNHVDDWVTFSLRSEIPGETNALNWPIVGTGAKVGFCLMDYHSCTASIANGHCRTSQEYQGGTALNSTTNYPNYGLGGGSYNCSQVSQGITVGYTDVYWEELDGMWINIPPGTCNGNYWVVMEVDPRNNFIEENENNNWTAVPFTLTQQVPGGGPFASITASGATTTCAGTPLTLTAAFGTSYAWSNGATTRTITPTTSGSYTCTISGNCGTDAATTSVTFLNAATPVGTGAQIPGPGQATLQATGGNVHWYDAASGGGEVGTGNQFTTPLISGTTTYWAENQVVQPGLSGNVGKTNNSGGGGYGTFDQHLVFDSFRPCKLRSVKVYAQSAGNRTFQVLTSAGDLVAQATVNVPNGESRVTLNLDLPQASNLRLKVTATSINLYRNTSGTTFPYTISNLVSVRTSSAGDQYYYYCYDWDVAEPDLTCASARVPVVAEVANGVVVNVKAFLEGPFDTANGLMADSLRVNGLIPLSEPFSAMGFTQAGGGGGEVMPASMLTTTGNNAIVDWVLVELRNASVPATIVATQSALITRSGNVISANGSPVRLSVQNGNYYIALRHRNHFGVMSAVPLSLSASATSFDLSLLSTATWGTEARKTKGAVQTLWSGEVVRDGKIMYTGSGNDRDVMLVTIGGAVATNVANGYLRDDLNLDGRVKYTGAANDRDLILVNIGGMVATNIRHQQLP
ncbi:MAG: hypothetical protein KBA60_03875 [Flavobacteriales bacterium]|nr:hypothetical protein [Flavobacteriales bacterium]